MRFWPLAAHVLMSSAAGPAEPGFAPGQVWAYQTCPGEEGSTLTIVRVDTLPKLGVTVHVSLAGLRVRNPAAGGYSETIAHLPFSEDAVGRSIVRKLRDVAPLPRYEEGYREWRRAYDAERAGVFTITVAEAVTYMEKVLNQ